MIFGSDKFPAQEDLAGSRRSARAVGGFPGLVASEAAGMAGDGSAMVAGRAQAGPEAGIDRLAKEIEDLRDQIAAHHDPSKPKQKPQDSARQQGGSYRGIQKKSENAWSASIFVTCLDRQWMLGTFPTAELAAQMYDAAAHVVFGDDACYNFPDAPNRDPPLATDVAREQLNRRPGKRTTCAECGQECPVKNKNCFVCRTPLKAFNVMKGVQRRLLPGATRPKFMAVFSLGGRTTTLGTYWTEEEAAYHYDREARTVHRDCDDPAKQRCNYPSLEAAKEAADAALRKLEEENGGPLPKIHPKTKKNKIVKGGVAWRVVSSGAKPEDETKKKRRRDHSKTKASKSGGKKGGAKKRKRAGEGNGDGRLRRGVRAAKDAVKSGGLDLSVAFARKKMDVKSMLFGHLLDVDGTPSLGQTPA